MQLSTTFRHMEASQAVREYAEDKLDKFKKYFSRELVGAHAVFSVERNHNHTAEFSLTLPNGLAVQARETTEDMYSSIDLAVARIERQVRKWKDKIRDHKPHGDAGYSVRETVLTAEAFEPAPSAAISVPGDRKPPAAPTAPARMPVRPRTAIAA
jgi:putative sigma-54 modulation protein